jgi:hypothetical protein
MDALPVIQYYGDRDKALTLKGYALSHYNRVLNSMGNTLTANRTDEFGDGIVINCIVNTNAYGNKTGMIRVFVPVAEKEGALRFYTAFQDISVTPTSTQVFTKGGLTPVLYPVFSIGEYYWFGINNECVSWAFRPSESIRNAVIHKRELINNVGEIQTIGNRRTAICCCAIAANGYLVAIEKEIKESFEPPETLLYRVVSTYKMELSVFYGDMRAVRQSVTRISDTQYGSATIGEIRGVFLKAGKEALVISAIGSTLAIEHHAFSDDYTVSVKTTVFLTDYFNHSLALVNHGDDIVLVHTQETVIELSAYNKESKTFSIYRSIAKESNKVKALLYANHRLGVEVVRNIIGNGSHTIGTAQDNELTVDVFINSVETQVLSSVEQYYADMGDFSMLYYSDNARHAAFDGRTIVVGFDNQPRNNVSTAFYSRTTKSWALIIDVSNLSWRVEAFTPFVRPPEWDNTIKWIDTQPNVCITDVPPQHL